MIEVRVGKSCPVKSGVIAERLTRDVVKRDERWEFASDNERGKNTEVTTGASERWATESKKRADDEGPEEEGRVKSKEMWVAWLTTCLWLRTSNNVHSRTVGSPSEIPKTVSRVLAWYLMSRGVCVCLCAVSECH